MASNAIDITRVGRVTGWDLETADFSDVPRNLPQRIIVLGEANEDMQANLITTQVQATTTQRVAELYGPGSPMAHMSRILLPMFGDGVGGIPVIFIAQEKAVGATQKEMTVTVTGTATANTTHFLNICGRESIDGVSYALPIFVGDTADDIATRLGNTITNMLKSPLFVDDITTNVVTVQTKWAGLTAQGVSISVNVGDVDAGITYAIVQTVAGAGTPDISDALATFGEQWNTLIVNSYGTASTVVTALQTFNGIPRTISNPNPTGQFQPIIQRPFIAITGSVLDNELNFTDDLKGEVTIALAPAPLSKGLAMEAAANACVLYAPVAQNTPHLGIGGKLYPDMPIPEDGNIGSMDTYTNRDFYVKSGVSTVTLSSGRYRMEDFVTTYHPEGETPPAHQYVKDRTIDSNIRFTYHLEELDKVLDHVIANDQDVVEVEGVIKPSQWKAEVYTMIDGWVKRGLIADAPFSKKSVVVNVSAVNPTRFETTFDYKRTSTANVVPTTVRAGFNFGN